ncbi:MAG TPA: BON domain-containing protein [Polyangia bacterium]|nr:BON domain-containing protein [Polyangia bacterium]
MRATRSSVACLAFAASAFCASSATAMLALPAQMSGAIVLEAGPGGSASGMDDASITKRVEDKLADAAPTAEHVTVSTRNRIVTLSGRVDSDGMRDRVGALARAAKGVAAVNNQVIVIPKYPPAQQR